jgi:hypothetical protein
MDVCVFCVRLSCVYIVSGETASRPKKRLMRTYHWISLFKSYTQSANYLIEPKVILIANKESKKKLSSGTVRREPLTVYFNLFTVWP